MDKEATMLAAQARRDALCRDIRDLHNACEAGLSFRMKVEPKDTENVIRAGCRVINAQLSTHLFHSFYQIVLGELEENLRQAEAEYRKAARDFGGKADSLE